MMGITPTRRPLLVRFVEVASSRLTTAMAHVHSTAKTAVSRLDARNEARRLRYLIRHAEADLAVYESELDVLPAQIQITRARLGELRVQLALAEKNR